MSTGTPACQLDASLQAPPELPAFVCRYFFNTSGHSDFRVNEMVVLTGRVNAAKLSVYFRLFEEELKWPGVDFSLAENMEEIRDAMAGYAASLGQSNSVRREVERWLKLV